MKSWGSTLLFFGIGSFVLNVIGWEFIILSWIDAWGEVVGWTIRGAMIGLGLVLFFWSADSAEEGWEEEA